MSVYITKNIRCKRLINGKWATDARYGIWPFRWWRKVNAQGKFNEWGLEYPVEFDCQETAKTAALNYLARLGMEHPIDSPAPTPAKESISRPAFITGSRALGIANSESDIDVVILVTKDDEDRIKEMSGGRFPIRFGNLKLVHCDI